MHINLNLNLFKDCIDINGFIIPIQQGQQLQLNKVLNLKRSQATNVEWRNGGSKEFLFRWRREDDLHKC